MIKTTWPTFSFEFMAPRSDAESSRLFETITMLRELAPTFICVTCRASSREQTAELVGRLQKETDLEVMAHLVCYGATRYQIATFLDKLQRYGINNVLALRGDVEDPDLWSEVFHDGLAHGSDLVGFIAERRGFCIGGACYPFQLLYPVELREAYPRLFDLLEADDARLYRD